MVFRPPAPPGLPPRNRRQYPRADVRVKARLFHGEDRRYSFEATLNTRDISVGGIFFESTFFLKLGQLLEVELKLPPQNRTVRARGKVARIESSGKTSGFAIRFEEYYDSSEVVLANYFMDQVLRRFVEDYGRRKRIRYSPQDVNQLVDVLATWELHRSKDETALWGGRT